jgi:hypothetical protein
MKPRKITIILFAEAQVSVPNFLSVQTASATPAAPMTPPAPPAFDQPNLSGMLTRMLLLTDESNSVLG